MANSVESRFGKSTFNTFRRLTLGRTGVPAVESKPEKPHLQRRSSILGRLGTVRVLNEAVLGVDPDTNQSPNSQTPVPEKILVPLLDPARTAVIRKKI